MIKKQNSAVVLGLFVFLLESSTFAADYLYFHQQQSFGFSGTSRANADGNQAQDMFGNPTWGGVFMDVDPRASGKLYYTYGWEIRRSDLDGANVESLYTSNDLQPWDVAVDPVENKLYVAYTNENTTAGGIERANLNGSNREFILSGPAIGGIDVDPIRGKIYWNAMGKIWRSNLDGTSPQELLTAAASRVRVDPEAGKLYWTTHGVGNFAGSVSRANLDGSNVQVILPNRNQPIELALLPGMNKVYWSDGGSSNNIMRANLDGTQVEVIKEPSGQNPPAYTLGTVAEVPDVLAAVPAASTWGLIILCISTLTAGMLALRRKAVA